MNIAQRTQRLDQRAVVATRDNWDLESRPPPLELESQSQRTKNIIVASFDCYSYSLVFRRCKQKNIHI